MKLFRRYLTSSSPPFVPENFTSLLQTQGFSKSQAESIISCLDEVVSESLNELSDGLLLKSENEQTIHANKIDFAHLKSEIHLLEKNDFATLKQENEKIQQEIEKLKTRIPEDIHHVQNEIRKELDFDKSRSMDEFGSLLNRIKENEMKLEREILNMKNGIDNVKWGTIKALSMTMTSVGLAVRVFILIKILGLIRYYKS